MSSSFTKTRLPFLEFFLTRSLPLLLGSFKLSFDGLEFVLFLMLWLLLPELSFLHSFIICVSCSSSSSIKFLYFLGCFLVFLSTRFLETSENPGPLLYPWFNDLSFSIPRIAINLISRWWNIRAIHLTRRLFGLTEVISPVFITRISDLSGLNLGRTQSFRRLICLKLFSSWNDIWPTSAVSYGLILLSFLFHLFDGIRNVGIVEMIFDFLVILYLINFLIYQIFILLTYDVFILWRHGLFLIRWSFFDR